MLKKANYKILALFILNIAATFFWYNAIIGRLETVQAMADGKTPVTIIMYHSILPDRFGEYVISPEQFESDIKYLSDNGYNFITMTELINFVNKKRAKLPDKPVMITFDDGYYNNYLYAYPIAKKYNACFVISILGYYTDANKEGEKMSKYYSHLTWEQINEMNKSGLVEIQNHSYNLHKNSKARLGSAKSSNETAEEYKKFLTEDVMTLQKLLKKKTGIEPNTFTYPFGRISPESVEILKDLDFEAMLTCGSGINYVGKGDKELLYSLKRFNRPYGKSSASYFKGKLAPGD